MTIKECYQDHIQWCNEEGHTPYKTTKFYKNFKEFGMDAIIMPKKRVFTCKKRGWLKRLLNYILPKR